MIPLYGNYLAYKSLLTPYEKSSEVKKSVKIQEALANLKKCPHLLIKDIEASATKPAKPDRNRGIIVISRDQINYMLIRHLLSFKEPAWMKDMKRQQLLYYVMSNLRKIEVPLKPQQDDLELYLQEAPKKNFWASIQSVLPRIILLGMLILSVNFQRNQEESKYLKDVCFPTIKPPFFESPFLDHNSNFITNSVAPFEFLQPQAAPLASVNPISWLAMLAAGTLIGGIAQLQN
jgi:hypothetical protein